MPNIETNSYILCTQSDLFLAIGQRTLCAINILTAMILKPGKNFKFTYYDKNEFYSFQGLEDVNSEENLINNQKPHVHITLGIMDRMFLYLSPMSKVIFSQNDNSYYLENSTEKALSILDITLLINICKHLNTIFANTETIKIDFSDIKYSDIKYFKEYEYINKLFTKNSIDLFAQQNSMSFNTKKVNLFIENNFFALSGIAKKPTYSGEDTTNLTLTRLPNEMLNKICSYLQLKDISYDVKYSMQCLPLKLEDIISGVKDTEQNLLLKPEHIISDVKYSTQCTDNLTTPLLGEEPTE